MHALRSFLVALCLTLCVSAITIEFQLANMMPEGITYSRQHGFLVGSIGLGQIHRIDLDGTITRFSNTPNLISSVGIQVDERNNRIYCTNNRGIFPNTNSQGSVVVLRLDNGAFVAEYDLSGLGNPNEPKLINDLSLPDNDNNIYVTNSFNQHVYRVNLRTSAVSLFIDDPLLDPGLDGLGPNGIEIWRGRYLLVANTVTNSSTPALFKVNLNDSSRQLRAVSLPPIEYPSFDGLTFDRNTGNLFAVGAQSIIYEFASNDDWNSARIVNAYRLSSPTITTCAVVDRSVFGLAANNFLPDAPYYIEQGDRNQVNFDYSDNAQRLSVMSMLIVVCLLLI